MGNYLKKILKISLIVGGFIIPQRTNKTNLEGKLESFDVYEKEIYRKAYEIYGSFNAAGKALGVTHKTVASKLRKYEII